MAKSLIPAQRHQRIQTYLEQHQVARSDELGRLLQVSEATVRRDLETLESRGWLERTHGGAVLTLRLPHEPVYDQSASLHPAEKRAIGRAAAGLVIDGDTIFLNSGTTTTEVMRHLARRDDLTHLTLVTTNVTATLEARHPGFEVLLLGGLFRPQSNAVVGSFARRALNQIYAAKCFIGVDGMSPRAGFTTPISAEAEVARLMVERTRGQVIIVADHSKWGVVSNFEIASLTRVSVLVTDSRLPGRARADVRAASIRLVLAPVESGPNGHLARRPRTE
ncbi:MAG TPA: DeoR/GlpR family DNA-binding transcription regulator [Anaerolineales bacterium]|nr:DeoR/GlpR family DNA-binding transcription regulator [Anaerolineales bacterium]